MTSERPTLDAQGLCAQLPTGRVLYRDLGLKLFPRQWAIISGPNGSGKTTLLRELKKKVRSGINYSYLPQLNSPDLPFPLTLRELIRFEIPSASDEKILSLKLLTQQNLDQKWSHASGGERKRSLLCRVLLGRPKIVFLDEPFNHLDRESRYQMLKVLESLTVKKELDSVVMVSHVFDREILSSDLELKEVVLDE